MKFDDDILFIKSEVIMQQSHDNGMNALYSCVFVEKATLWYDRQVVI